MMQVWVQLALARETSTCDGRFKAEGLGPEGARFGEGNNLWAKPTRPPCKGTASKIAILTFSAFLCAGSMRDRRSSSNCVDW